MQTVKLANGVHMPVLGYGVFQVSPEECVRCVKEALACGYRSIDTAQAYHNEAKVGQAIKESGVARADIFLTTKIWISNAGEAKAAASIDESLRKLQTDYLDLLLIHQPFGDYYGTWRAMEAAYKAGKARAIGVSNFYPDRLIDIAHFNEIKPMVNQVETHVFNQQTAAQKTMKKLECALMSWAPLAEGRNGLFTNGTLTAIGAKYGKTPAQAALRWLTQRNIIVIPKTTHKERMIENLSIFDFTLTDDDMTAIAALDLGKSQWFNHQSAETAEQFMQWAGMH
ncbi:aldo/keto reductase [Duodenibacillus massiliensis]|uniref:aldo/keto reductase n=1 Tax=Duodenibacillus massiliensis TaxID=1852381 RepID=UPI003F7CD628